MKADATLVNAAFALGQSYVPADYSAIFEKQYEGIIAANAAKSKMYGDIATSAGNLIGTAANAFGKRKGLQKAIDEEITTNPVPEPKGKKERDKADEEQQKWLDKNTGDDKDITGKGYLAPQEQEAVTDGSLEGELNSQAKDGLPGGKIVRDGKWVNYDPNTNSAEVAPGGGSQYQMGGGFGGGGGMPTLEGAYGGPDVSEEAWRAWHKELGVDFDVNITDVTSKSNDGMPLGYEGWKERQIREHTTEAPIEVGVSGIGPVPYPAAGGGDIGSVFVIDDQINTMASDYVVGAMSGLDAHYKNGGTFGDSQFDAAQGEFERLKTELETISNKLFPSKEDKRNRNKLRKEALALQSTLNNSVANIKAKAELFANDEIYLAGLNKDITVDGVNHLGPDLSILIGQIFDPTTTKSDQVEFFFKDGQKMIRYAPGRAGIAYNKAKGTKGKKIPKSEWKTISENQLLNQVQAKDKDTNIAMNATMAQLMKDTEELVGDTKNPKIANFDEIKDRVHKGNVETLSGKNVNLTYAAREDQLVGNTTRNFSKDYLKNYKLDRVINNTFGIGSDILTMADINGDGFINKADTDFAKSKGMAELRKHNAAKEAFMKELTNPKTEAEKKLLINELADSWTKHNEAAFKATRAKMGLGDDLFDLPWKKGNALPTTQIGKNQKRIVDSVVNGSKTIKVGDDTYELNEETGAYKHIKTKPRKEDGEWVSILNKKEMTKTQFIQEYGGIYGDVPNDFFQGFNPKFPGTNVNGGGGAPLN